MTLHLTLYNDAKLKYGPDRNTESQRYQKLTCDKVCNMINKVIVKENCELSGYSFILGNMMVKGH